MSPSGQSISPSVREEGRAILGRALDVEGLPFRAFLGEEALRAALRPAVPADGRADGSPYPRDELERAYDVSSAKGAVVAALPYDTTEPAARPAGAARIAWFARSDHYGELVARLGRVAAMLRAAGGWRRRDVRCLSNSMVDEKALAVASGLGIRGRHSLVIVPGLGCACVLGVMLLPFDPTDSDERQPRRHGDDQPLKGNHGDDQQFKCNHGAKLGEYSSVDTEVAPRRSRREEGREVEGREAEEQSMERTGRTEITISSVKMSGDDAREFPLCGECRACVEACPTGAITEAGVDRRRCLQAYSAREGDLPPSVEAAWGDILYGCDACIAACPHAKLGRRADIARGRLPAFVEAVELTDASDGEIRARFRGTALGQGWIRPAALRRNASLASRRP